jgi:hypothetical protein
MTEVIPDSHTEHRPCPACGSTDAIRIIYGFPDIELSMASLSGDVALGGCMCGPESPDFECRDCGSPLPWVADDNDERYPSFR